MKKSWSIQSCCQQSMEYLQLTLMGASPNSEAIVMPYFSICSWGNMWIGQLRPFYKYLITESAMAVLVPSEGVTQCITITWVLMVAVWIPSRGSPCVPPFHIAYKMLQYPWLQGNIFSVLWNGCATAAFAMLCCSTSIWLNFEFGIHSRGKENHPKFCWVAR